MTRKRQPEPVAAPAAISYRGFRSAGRWIVERDNQAFRYSKYESSEVAHNGPWRWGPREQFTRLLSWALLMDVLDDEEEVGALVEVFDQQYTRRFHPCGWMMSADNIRAACDRLKIEMRPDYARKPR